MSISRCLVPAALLFGLTAALSAATFTVNSAADTDDGVCNAASCTLREAINAANANPGTDTIRFSIGTGAKTIAPLSSLPAITEPVTLDGTTQPGYAGTPIIELNGASAGAGATGLQINGGTSLVTGLAVNGFAAAFPATGGHGIVLQTVGGNEIRGCYIGTNVAGTAAVPNGGDGIRIAGSPDNLIGRTDSANRINVISGNAGSGVHVLGAGATGNVIAGNRIGTNAAGTASVANSLSAVLFGSGSDNVIGSATIGDTLLSGNGGDGVTIDNSATGTIVQGCYIGTNAAGTAALPNQSQGVYMGGSSGNTIGPSNVISGNMLNGVLVINGGTGNTVTGNLVGTDATGALAIANLQNGVIVSGSTANTVGPGNVISGNATNGVRIRTDAANNAVRGNTIGLNATLTAAIPNLLEGVQVNERATNNTIGGPGTDRNVISGNGNNGVLLTDDTTTGNVVTGNFIGTNATASAAFPNAASGVDIQAGASNNTVGGTVAGTKNVIAFNGGRGVFVEAGTGNAILGNTISYNGVLGIDLGPAGVTPNDLGDPDPGANLLQNFPVISAIVLDPTSTQIQGSLNSLSSTTFRVELFADIVCDASGYGPGQRPLGASTVMTDAGGNVAIATTLAGPATGPWITATATDPAGNTSEFSACLAVPGPTVSLVSPASGPAAGNTPLVITGTNYQAPAVVKVGGVAASMVTVISGTQVNAATPALAPGALYDVTVVNPSTLSGTLSAVWLADFTDVAQDNIFHDDVEIIFRGGITAGCGGGNYCPGQAVTRAQMAVFLLKSEHGSAYLPPMCAGVFADVPCPSPFANWIEQLAAENITAGCGGGNYCPDQAVTRAQMAVFLLRTKHGPAYVPPTCASVFSDVVCPSQFADWIEELYAEQITGGCQTSPLLYCPSNPVNRGQMAVFLVKTFPAP
jgi:CSLREA domain-containing protein